MEKGKAVVDMGSDQEFHLRHIGDFCKHPNGGVKQAVVHLSWI